MLHGITFIDGGWRPAIAKEGRKWTQVVYTDGSSVRVKKVKACPKFKPLACFDDQHHFCKRMLAKKNCLGIKKHFSKAALAILKEGLES